MGKRLIAVLLLLITGCSSNGLIDRGEYKVDASNAAISQNERVRFLVIHYTALDDVGSKRTLTQEEVSSHYLVLNHPKKNDNKPVVLQLVPENKRAWNAGVSNWHGRNNLNDSSIGIEIVNLGFTERFFGRKWYAFNEEQIELIERLAKDIVERYDIDPTDVVGHSDIAPLRKSDPGPYFPWQRLAKIGIGAWPDDAIVKKYIGERNKDDLASVSVIQETLAKYGYAIAQTGELDTDTRKFISAFQMHFRPSNYTGVPDVETEAIALALVEKYRSK